MVIIELLDCGYDRYTQKNNTNILGRRYDHNAQQILVKYPNEELLSKCFMIITTNGKSVDYLEVKNNEPVDITSNITQYKNLEIGFSFQREDGYIKNSEIKNYETRDAQKPDEFIPEKPNAVLGLGMLFNTGFVNAYLQDNGVLVFYNLSNEIVKEIDLTVVAGLKKKIVETLPTYNIDEKTIYLVKKQNSTGNDYYDEYLFIDGNFEFIGTTQIDLTDYVKNTDYASYNKAGVVKINGTYGVVSYNDKGDIGLTTCPNENIINKTGYYAIQPTNIDLAVKVGLTTNKETLTPEEKTQVQNWLGITELVGNIDTLLEKLDTGSGV